MNEKYKAINVLAADYKKLKKFAAKSHRTMVGTITHLLRGRKGCPKCEGTGVYFAPNGPDDYQKEVCECVDL